MTDLTPSAGGTPSRTASERLTRFSHRYVLPITGACAATLGILILLGLRPIQGPTLYSTLLLAGLGALVSSFGFLAWQETVPHPSPATRSKPTRHSPTLSKTVEPSAKSVDPTRSVPLSGLGRAAVSAAFRTGDQIWHQWTTPRTRPLGVEVTGPVAASWYIPPKAGALNPYSRRDEDLVFVNAGRIAPVTPSSTLAGEPPVPNPSLARGSGRAVKIVTPRAVPFTDTELDTLFPPEAQLPRGAPTAPATPAHLSESPSPSRENARPSSPGPDVLPPSPAPTGRSTPPEPSAGPTVAWELAGPEAFAGVSEPEPIFSGLGGLLPTLDAIDHQVYLEAINPLPPDLRSQPLRRGPRGEGLGPAPSERHDRGGFCSMCARKLSDFRSWVECPRCSDPLCRECLGLSFLTGAEGRCFTCRDAHGTPAA